MPVVHCVGKKNGQGCIKLCIKYNKGNRVKFDLNVVGDVYSVMHHLAIYDGSEIIAKAY